MGTQKRNTSKQLSGLTNATSTSRLPIAYELELHRVIEQEAYLNAAKDGFRGCPQDYWLAAERVVHQYY